MLEGIDKFLSEDYTASQILYMNKISGRLTIALERKSIDFISLLKGRNRRPILVSSSFAKDMDVSSYESVLVYDETGTGDSNLLSLDDIARMPNNTILLVGLTSEDFLASLARRLEVGLIDHVFVVLEEEKSEQLTKLIEFAQYLGMNDYVLPRGRMNTKRRKEIESKY